MTELCAEADPELFFRDTKRHRAKAKAICKRCPVIEACLAYSLEHKEPHGVWGGVDEHERHKLLHPPRKPGKSYHHSKDAPAPGWSEVRGVTWNSYKGQWAVSVRHGGKTHWVGSFASQEAAEAAAITKCGELGTSTVRARARKAA